MLVYISARQGGTVRATVSQEKSISDRSATASDVAAWQRWGAPFGLVVIATTLRFFTRTLFGETGTFLPFMTAITLAAYFGGRGPAYLALALSLVGVSLLSLHGDSEPIAALVWVGYLTLFCIVCAVIVEGIHRLRATMQALRASLENQRRAQHELLALERRIDRERRESDERLRAILDHASAIVFLKDRDGRYLFVNEEFLRAFETDREHLVGRLDREVFPEATVAVMRDHDAQVWSGDVPITAEETVSQPRGVRTYIATKFLLREPTGAPYALCGIATDISDRKAAEEALVEADQRKDVFLAVLAHELRNPLAPIRNAVRLLERSALPEDAIRARDIIGRQSQQMALLLDDLLDITRITHGTLELRKARIELAPVVEVAIETARPLIHARGHSLMVDLPKGPFAIEADPLRLAQILGNLLTNAAKYTDNGGSIWLSAARHGADLVITVRDSGIGLSKEGLRRLFQMFTRVHDDRDRSPGGLGIGLALTRGLVELHEGHIEARSAGPGRGSEFIVRLPAPATLAQSVRERSAPDLAAPEGRRILIADDNEDAALSLQYLLAAAGYEIRTVHDGEAALQAAQEFQPRFAILDIGMPGLTGYQVAERIRAQPWGRDMALIALTGWGQVADKRRAIDSGFDLHVTKPIDPVDLEEYLFAAARAHAQETPVADPS